MAVHYSNTMSHTAHPEAPALPEELARQVVQHLDCRDVCCAALASKAWWHLFGNALSHIEAEKTGKSLPDVNKKMESLQLFLSRRVPGLKVDRALFMHNFAVLLS